MYIILDMVMPESLGFEEKKHLLKMRSEKTMAESNIHV